MVAVPISQYSENNKSLSLTSLRGIQSKCHSLTWPGLWGCWTKSTANNHVTKELLDVTVLVFIIINSTLIYY